MSNTEGADSRTSEYLLGSILIMPMLTDGSNQGSLSKLRSVSAEKTIATADLSIGVRELFGQKNGLLDECREVKAADFNRMLFGDRKSFDLMVENDPARVLSIGDLIIYIFHSGVAFACSVIRYTDIGILAKTCHPGYASGSCRYSFLSAENDRASFSPVEDEDVPLEHLLETKLEELGLKSFYGKNSLFLEAYIYNLAVRSDRFMTLDELQQASFHMHLMAPMEEPVEDPSEEDVAFVYSKKDLSLDSYRWACCISSQTISYVTADKNMDFAGEMSSQIEDGLPLAILALYQKYTCLHFGRLLLENSKGRKKIADMKRRMLAFKAYGTVSAATISRWYNVRMIYADMLQFFGVPEAVSEISDKLEMLADAQKEMEEERTNALMTGITIFGIVSILDSLMSIYEVIVNGNTAEWFMLRSSVAVIVLLFILFIFLIRKIK